MRLRSPEYRRFKETSSITAGLVRAAVVLAMVGLWGVAGISQSAAQQAQQGGSTVAFVEAVSGRVVAFARGTPNLLDALDAIGDRTRLDLQPNSELRICHYSSGRLHVLRGPLRVSISAAAVTAESGRTIDRAAESCAAPAISKFQGGLVSRGLESEAQAASRSRRRGLDAAR